MIVQRRPSDDELTQFGIRFEDDEMRPYDPEEPSWNDSVFYDFYNEDGSTAGHVRIGALPNEGRVWFWLYLYRNGEWLVIEEPRVPFGELDPKTFGYDRAGLQFGRTIEEPLRTSRLWCSGFARVVSGPRAGRILPVSLDLQVEGIGPAHTVGDSGVEGHSSDGYDARRFEQPTAVEGKISIEGIDEAFVGRGERDHSWGPRFWNMEWTLLIVNGPDYRQQCVRAQFDEESFMDVGYLATPAGTEHVVKAEFDLDFRHDSLVEPFVGGVTIETESGTTRTGRIENIACAEVYLEHMLDPPQPTTYRRGLVRYVPDDGSEPCLGWIEYNRFPNGIPSSA